MQKGSWTVWPPQLSYFNTSDAASKHLAWVKCENAELKEKEAKLESDNTKLSQRLQEKEDRIWILESELKERATLEASILSQIDMVELQKARVESALEAKTHELAQIAGRIPSLEDAVARNEAQAILNQTIEAAWLGDFSYTRYRGAASCSYSLDM